MLKYACFTAYGEFNFIRFCTLGHFPSSLGKCLFLCYGNQAKIGGEIYVKSKIIWYQKGTSLVFKENAARLPVAGKKYFKF